jgi:Zn-dependent protease with chaperone function
MSPKTLLIVFACCWAALPGIKAQALYPFQKDDTTVKLKYYAEALENKNSLVNALAKEFRSDYKEIYEARFESVAELLKSSRTVTEPVAHSYLQSILKKIVDANPELKPLPIRLVFTRDPVPNAYSTGEGTLAVNAGLFVFFDNEAQLVFTICHELAHLYLDHGNIDIRKSVEYFNSKEFKTEAKQVSKQEYGVGKRLEELVKKIVFSNRRHSREDEAAADRQAVSFMRKTGYDLGQAGACLELLNKIDDTTLFRPVNLEEHFNFAEYPFRKKWVQKESSIFSQMSHDESPLTQAEKDSLRTHPDCLQRIELLKDSIGNMGKGAHFLVQEQLFHKLKTDFIVEMAEQQYKNNNLGLHLYMCLQLLQKKEYEAYAAFSVVRCFNRLYEHQKKHSLGLVADKESRVYPKDYNALLRMIDKLRLEELASLAYHFGKKYAGQLSAFNDFVVQMRVAEKLKTEN